MIKLRNEIQTELNVFGMLSSNLIDVEVWCFKIEYSDICCFYIRTAQNWEFFFIGQSIFFAQCKANERRKIM